jgi:hypothetical protein
MVMAARFWDNRSFIEAETLLRQLHSLTAAGAGDSEAADQVRDAMDKPWRQLSREEVARLDGLSADLYQVEDDEPVDGADLGGRTPETFAAELATAIRLQQWEVMLSLLRQRPPDSPPERVALQRAFAYRNLGHLDAALLFMEYAARIKPDIPEYERVNKG